MQLNSRRYIAVASNAEIKICVFHEIKSIDRILMSLYTKKLIVLALTFNKFLYMPCIILLWKSCCLKQSDISQRHQLKGSLPGSVD